MYKIILMAVCLDNAVNPAAKNIYINDIAAVKFIDEVEDGDIGICPAPMTEDLAQSRIREVETTHPVWQLTPETTPSRTLIRAPYYLSEGKSEKDSIIYRLVPLAKPQP